MGHNDREAKSNSQPKMTATQKKTILLNELDEAPTKPKYIQNGAMLKAKLPKTPRTTGAKTQAREL